MEDPAVSVNREKVVQALHAASRGVKIQMMAEICQRVLDEFGMPDEWEWIFKKGDIRHCNCYGAMTLLEHEIKWWKVC